MKQWPQALEQLKDDFLLGVQQKLQGCVTDAAHERFLKAAMDEFATWVHLVDLEVRASSNTHLS
jgi:hypothetical protein